MYFKYRPHKNITSLYANRICVLYEDYIFVIGTCEEKLCTAYEENGLRPTQTPGTTHQRTHPSYPMYLSFQKRLESFTAWTAKHVHTPSQLATAGFFYAGYADCVRCYQCGLGLKSWKPGDDIHLEHKKYRPTCPLLQP
ncbi:baculoviral IAP repeat-containing protein 7-B-like [Physella acuta]|uniref:baculoviral IAP repeat-containing protein 7-B-like n=1 Tax=Physella acuta TaxID=109671 RepID=UPI0027DCEB9C|nr:baculoviral IAP repeat-containing protein 7-B-like [Physella acuta]